MLEAITGQESIKTHSEKKRESKLVRLPLDSRASADVADGQVAEDGDLELVGQAVPVELCLRGHG